MRSPADVFVVAQERFWRLFARNAAKNIDRLLIEPTGLAALSGILDTLELPGIRELVDVRSIICLVDTTRLREDLAQDVVADQVEAADVLVANRSDLATAEHLEKFNRWGSSLFPPKKA